MNRKRLETLAVLAVAVAVLVLVIVVGFIG
jgi:hypothetical protein